MTIQQANMFLLLCLSLFATLSAASPGVTTKCLYPPIGNLPHGCAVSNLAVSSSSKGNLIISDWKCNQTVDSGDFDYPPIIKFLNMPIAFQRNQTYLVSIVDKTTNQLLWLVANITVANKTLTPGTLPWYGIFKNSLIIKSYQPPAISMSQNNHSIEILVLEEKFTNPSALSQMTHSTYESHKNFFLRNWLQLQTASGQITFCGPVGGGIAIAYKRHNTGPLYPTQVYHPHVPLAYPNTPPPSQYNPYPLNPHPENPYVNHQPAYQPNYPSHGNTGGSTKGNLKRNSATSNVATCALVLGLFSLSQFIIGDHFNSI